MTALTPPLIAMMEGRKVRARWKAAAPKELALHMPVAKLLREHCLAEWQWAHYPSGEERTIRAATKLKQMGMKRGWPDIMLVSPDGRLHCLELKRSEKSVLTDAQKDFRSWCVLHGVPYVIAWTMDAVLLALTTWECLNVVLPPSAKADSQAP